MKPWSAITTLAALGTLGVFALILFGASAQVRPAPTQHVHDWRCDVDRATCPDPTATPFATVIWSRPTDPLCNTPAVTRLRLENGIELSIHGAELERGARLLLESPDAR